MTYSLDLGDFCSCVALGGVSKEPDIATDEWLRTRKLILYSLDCDEVGRKRYDFWRAKFPNLRAWPADSNKSPADSFVKDGLNLKEWFLAGISYWLQSMSAMKEGYAVARHIFGAEPTDPEVYEFVLTHYQELKFGEPKEFTLEIKRMNPKRVQKEVRREMERIKETTKPSPDSAYAIAKQKDLSFWPFKWRRASDSLCRRKSQCAYSWICAFIACYPKSSKYATRHGWGMGECTFA